MQYLTKEWCFGEMSDEEVDERLLQYRKYIDEIYISLPFVLKILSKHISLHDGIINLIEYSDEKVIIHGTFGDLEIGYFGLIISYETLPKSLDYTWLEQNLENKNIEILSDEIEFLDLGNYSHKLLFSSKQELEIKFQNIYMEIFNSTSNFYQKALCKLIKLIELQQNE